ncbi:isoleucine--tRNA ligase, cytoplasmic [Hetaerina americana]|uniref:isoleucine--tRNA ligase, cytoplasmic n=1 Tax=Hetaerina americana TaxID=62018 RepID=UPI003A7F1019
MEKVAETINFPDEEEKILKFWKKIDVFNSCLKQSKGKPRYSFYDGPPFATGLPHYGHLLAGTIKDIVTRYAHQRGFHVERRFGWDCHGLPVEYEIDKVLGIKGPDDVAKMGIKKYNDECRKIVMRYSDEWEVVVGRLGRWIDFKNDYKTLYPWFMESVWWVFKELFNKGLVYRGVKVMPYSTACNTPLSNFESGQNYKEVVDPAVIVSFPLDDEPSVSMIAWTTTPWTLPSNLSLCVNPKLDYVKLTDNSTGKTYIMMEARIGSLFKSEDEYMILERFKGESLRGRRYDPLFPYFSHLKAKGAFCILSDGYVTEESGTGVVHQAPYFGEDDYRVCLAAGVISRDQEMICPVDASGKFVEPVTDFLGQHVKDADKDIIKFLKGQGRLVSAATTKHNYPFCWRSETPLIYKAVPSWFIRVEPLVKDLLNANQQTYWVPDFVKEKRFGNWLREARDWAVSRNRYWGTPIPLWVSEDGQEVVCIGSIKELELMTGEHISDLHRESIDHLTIPSVRPGGLPLRRVPEVFDCWFESGSMPYAQQHYPFENKKEFEESFPADFIAEGIDQTRGWFYTLLVISTALFNKPPFKNLIANGLVLANDGQKMSKRKKNYPDPMEVVGKFGSDALRLYLINSPVVRADNLRFKEEGVRDILKDVFLPWYNAYRFLIQNVERFCKEENTDFKYNEVTFKLSGNTMDQWILSFTQTLLQFVKQEMAAYHLYTVVPRLVKFIDHLTNWYVRMNRKRIKGEGGLEDCSSALETLTSVLYSMIRVMAPFTPFLTEHMYQNVRHLVEREELAQDESVHYLMLPEPRNDLVNSEIERAVSRMQSVIDMGRVIRDRKTIPVKYPLPAVVVIHKSEECLRDILSLKSYILEELNVKSLTVTTEKHKYGVSLRAEPDHKTLGARLKGDFKSAMTAIKELTDEQINQFLASGSIEILGHTLETEDLRIMFNFTGTAAKELAEKYEAHSEGELLVLLDVTPDQTMLDEGLAREVINRVQKLRKKAHLVPLDAVDVYYQVTPESGGLSAIIVSHKEFIESTTKTPMHPLCEYSSQSVIMDEKTLIKGTTLYLKLTKNSNLSSSQKSVGELENKPIVSYVNVWLCDGLPTRLGIKGSHGTLLLENPVGENLLLSMAQFQKEVDNLFGLYGIRYKLCLFDGGLQEISHNSEVDVKNWMGKEIFICPLKEDASIKCECPQKGETAVGFVNIDFEGKKGTILLENPSGDRSLGIEEVERRVMMLYGLQCKQVNLFSSSDCSSPPLGLMEPTLRGTTLFAKPV